MKALKSVAMICALFAVINAERTFAQGIILNGGFEAPAIQPNSNQDVDPDGWLRIPSTWGFITHLFNGNGGISDVPMAHGGNQHFLLGFLGTGISQNVTLSESSLFRLDWWTSTDAFESSVRMTYNVCLWNNQNSSLVTSNQFEAQLSSVWTGANMEVYLQPGSYLVEFKTTEFFNNGGIFLDDVSMTPVPEPNIRTLFGFGLFTMLVLPRLLGRRKY